MPSGSCRCRASQLHNAHHFQTVTVYYRWHPLYGQTLAVWRRTRNRHGEHVFCRLPDDTLCALPVWMFDPACAESTLGPAVIAVDALSALRDLLDALRGVDGGGQASSLRSPREEVDEATDTTISSDHPTESPASSVAHVCGAGRQAGGAGPRPCGAPDRRRSRRARGRRR